MRCYGFGEELVCRKALDLTEGLNTLLFLSLVGFMFWSVKKI